MIIIDKLEKRDGKDNAPSPREKTKASEKKEAAAKEPKKKPDPAEKSDVRRRARPLDAGEVFVPDSGEDDRNGIFCKRLTYLMNGNSSLAKPVNIQELADAVGVSRPAIRKYLKPRDRGEPTTPSATTVCRIAAFFGTTPNFLLGFDGEEDVEAVRLAHESDYYNGLGLNQHTIDMLRELRSRRSAKAEGDRAAELMSMLDKQICSFVGDALALIDAKNK